MKTIYNIFVLANLMLLTYTSVAQDSGLPLFNYEGKTIIHDTKVIEEVPLQEFNLPITILDSLNSPPPPPLNEDRKVFWIHGLSGTEHAWLSAADASEYNLDNPIPGFPPRKLKSYANITYPQNTNISAAVAFFASVIDEKFKVTDDRNQSFMICHSQGGIMARSYYHKLLCRNNHVDLETLPGGYVTFSTPHGGAHILNNLDFDDPSSEGFIFLNSMVKDLSSPWLHAARLGLPTYERKFLGIKYLSVKGQELISYDLVEQLTEGMQDLFNDGLSFAIKQSFMPGITKDYRVGAEHLRMLVEESCTVVDEDVHKVAFYGVEPQKHIFARTVQYLINDPNLEDYGYFEANEDLDLLQDLKEIQISYINKYDKLFVKLEKLRIDYDNQGCKSFEKYYYGEPHYGEYGCDEIYDEKWWEWIFGWGPVKKYIEQQTCYDCWKKFKEINEYKAVIEKFKKAERWFNTVDQQWQNVIGAYQSTSKLVKRCLCIPHMDPNGEWIKFTIDASENCSAKAREYEGGGTWLCQEHTETHEFDAIIHPNDGIVLAESQRALPYMTLKPTVRPSIDLKMDNTSHMQVRNNTALKEKLFLLYNGEYDLFFKTEERD